MKKTIRLTEGMLRQMVKEAIDELDWKTYANAVKKQPSGYSRNYDANGNYGSQFRDEVNKTFQNKLKQLGLSDRELYYSDFDTWSDLIDEAEKEVKAKEEKMYQRQRNFRHSANDAFERDFGFEDETGSVKSHPIGVGRDMKIRPVTIDSNGCQNGNPRFFITNQNFYGQNGSHTPGKWCVGTVGWAGAVAASPDFDTKEEAEEYANNHNMPTKVVEPSKELQAAYQRARKEADNFDPREWNGNKLPSNYEYEKGKGWKLKNDNLDEAVKQAIRKVLR